MPDQIPSIGRMVHYRLPDGQVRPAVIVRVWGDCGGQCGSCGDCGGQCGSCGDCGGQCGSCGDCVNLAVFTDGCNDQGLISGPDCRPVVNVTSVMRGDNPGQWNWPPRA